MHLGKTWRESPVSRKTDVSDESAKEHCLAETNASALRYDIAYMRIKIVTKLEHFPLCISK